MDEAGIPALQDAIKHMHGCDSIWLESVSVTEMFKDKVVWDGEVQVFALKGHPKAKRAYAWSHATFGFPCIGLLRAVLRHATQWAA